MLRSIGKQSGESVESVLMRQTNGQTDGRSTVTQTSLSVNEWLQAATARASCVGATQHGRVSAEQQNWRRHQFVWSLDGAAAVQLEHGSTVRGYTEKTCRRRPHRPDLRVRLYSRKLPVNRSSSACRHIGRYRRPKLLQLLHPGCSVAELLAVGPGFKSQPRRCQVTVLGKLFTPIVPLFAKQRNW